MYGTRFKDMRLFTHYKMYFSFMCSWSINHITGMILHKNTLSLTYSEHRQLKNSRLLTAQASNRVCHAWKSYADSSFSAVDTLIWMSASCSEWNPLQETFSFSANQVTAADGPAPCTCTLTKVMSTTVSLEKHTSRRNMYSSSLRSGFSRRKPSHKRSRTWRQNFYFW
jgi:hypothetical protein